MLNKFTAEFLKVFCDIDSGSIQCDKIVEFNSSIAPPARKKVLKEIKL